MTFSEKMSHGLRATAAVVDITPRAPVDQGCGSRADLLRLQTNDERLEANILALWSSDDADPVLVVSIDALYPGRTLRDVVEAAAPELATDRIFLCATHTHAAPMTDPSKPLLGSPDESHMRMVSTQLRSAITRVLQRSEARTVDLHANVVTADHSVNRRKRQRYFLSRKPRLAHVAISPDRDGARDEAITTIELRTPSGDTVALLWNYACHPVAHPSPERNSAHYPGVVRTAMRKHERSSELPVLFLQGFSGNTRPTASIHASTVIDRIRTGGLAEKFETMTANAYDNWCDTLSDVVRRSFTQSKKVAGGDIHVARSLVGGSNFVKDMQDPVIFHALQLAPEVLVVGISAEPVAEYAAWTRATSPAAYTLTVGCVDHSYGYLPTASIVREGGYEGGEFCEYFGLNELTDGERIQEVTQETIRELVTTVTEGASS